MMTKQMVLENLTKLVGREFDADEVICAFEDFEEYGETEVIVSESSNDGYEYIAYVNAKGSTQFLFAADQDDVITAVWSW